MSCFNGPLFRSASGLQVPQVLPRQALHHRLLPQAPRFFAKVVWEFVIEKKKKDLNSKAGEEESSLPSASGEECASIFAGSSPPDNAAICGSTHSSFIQTNHVNVSHSISV